MGKRKKISKLKKVSHGESFPEQDEYFYYIAGYTSGGAPYGITWEDARRDGLIEEENDNGDIESGLEAFQ